MRVTNKMLSNNFLADMRANLENVNKIQQQNTSGKKFRKPSDDPFAVARSMQLHTDINTNKQYSKNITDVSNWLDTTDTALGQAGDVLQRVRELLISAGNAAYGSDERKAIKDEINEKIGEMSQILNTNFGGNYIFGGTRSTTKPMEAIGGEMAGAAPTKKIVIDEKIKESIVDKDGLKAELNVKFQSKDKKINSEISIPKKTKISSLSELANKVNEEIENKNKTLADDNKIKIKAMPNIADGKLMFINTDKTIGDITVTSSELGMDKGVESKYSSSSNTKLMYNKKGGGELTSGNEYDQIASKLKIEVSQGVTMDYNVSATDILEFTNDKSNKIDLRQVFSEITNHLDGKKSDGTAPDAKAVEELLNGDLKNITDSISNLLKIRSEVGARQNRIDGAKDRNTDGTFNMKQILTKHEDVDYTENMMDYATMLTVYMASLQTSAKIIQPSLMDYLR
ncbi:flagellar hook-associated protein 3 [Clostridium botulinum]|uniref:Flagellar hook-associated protein 3 n=1 Tax=Clostridium botulinum C/D str. DC5 TaxID=1443128 RepID=A0A0A0IK50_CLOBO|nr:flagellar hook-associated protein FlgL [Clostridium botulinum]KEI03856.1 flagellar hook-associated protein 3 [Clostridium botulinum C/D str. BKT75002]KEI09064.1 flagellar hook-associated protein 3 [Clostridium botulinum C/D str. BKT2873]KGN01840.1 flagellar hook-associated protein 3 [Clostridium botulinum C/D str. DC5]KOC51473.1 flagellar hook-associated protein 3 [Clostridium botulinum]KOC57620.1 flagellar hook-associated protein 3 [Clostridium botulinum]